MSGAVPAPRRWDPLVRITHWGIAAAVVINRLVTEGGSQLHVWIGLALAALLALRLGWGFVGPVEARFTSFPPSPRRAVAHVRDILAGRHVSHRSHNPLGALMAYALWASLAVVIASGIAMTGFPPKVHAEDGERPAAAATVLTHEDEEAGEGGEGEEGGELAEEVHEIAANLLLALAALHLLGVAFETRRSGRQIVLAMIGGKGKTKEP
ncbi:cytochrome b/b6 domain-containing protein [Caulobacter sp. ErkDOM-E]|uniref:cytochrome b/b6 domain-containing protein n=1 Tax=Caulobacter sp. ErkDOM-E TaxID=3402778 RepID=UPI003AF7F01F